MDATDINGDDTNKRCNEKQDDETDNKLKV